jgi:putative DNA primase/helicase
MQLENDLDACVTEVAPPPPAPDPEELADQHKRHWTPLGLAEWLIITFGLLFRYIAETGMWIVWADGRWHQDVASLGMFQLCKATLRHMMMNPNVGADLFAKFKKWVIECETEPMFRQVLALARSDRSITISVNALDQHKHLLCCPNGVVDLRTGELLPNRPELYLTKNTGVHYVPDAKFPQWDAFLDQITGGNANLRDALQLEVGYSLQGSCCEEKFFLLLGKGGTGKSTFLEAVSGGMGEYHVAANFSTFLKKDRVSSGPSEDIARLAGARLVTASECDDGGRFAEATLKQLTGGDKVNARFLYQNSFDFRPQFKLFFAVNHLPYMATDDPAIWRRVTLNRFDHQPETIQTNLKALFSTPEAQSAILSWAVKGTVQWYKTGLVVPPEILAANDWAREEMDPIAAFLKEECMIDPRCINAVTQFRQKYDEWAAQNGQRYTLDRRRFNRALEAKGFEQGVRKLRDGTKARCWLGLQWVGEEETIREIIQETLYPVPQGLFKS